MAIRDQLLKKLLRQAPPAPDPYKDPFETARPYRSWMPGIRTALRLRYLTHKEAILRENKQNLRYDVSADEMRYQVLDRLSRKPTGRGVWAFLLQPFVAVPLLLLLTAGGIYSAIALQKSAQDKNVFRIDIPRHSDTVYQLKAEQSENPESGKAAELQTELDGLQQNIIDHFDKLPVVQDKLSELLSAIQQKEFPPTELFNLSKTLNDELFVNGIPYYISPMIESAHCSHLPLTAFN